MKGKPLVFVIAAVLLIVVYTITFTVSEKEYVIVTRFGKPVRVIEDAGLHFKLPFFFETVNRLDRRIHVFVTQPIQLLLGDKNPIILTCYVCWKIASPSLFFQSITFTKVAQQKLGDMINSQLGSVLGDYHIDRIISTKPGEVAFEEIEQRIMVDSNPKARGKYGLEIVQLGLRRLNYPSIVAEAVYNRMRSEREKEAKKHRAQGAEEAAKIEAQTDKEVSEILAKAYQEAETIKGEGDREAIRIYAEAYGEDPEFFEFLKSLEIYKDILRDKSTLVLSTESELFKYLDSHEGGRD